MLTNTNQHEPSRLMKIVENNLKNYCIMIQSYPYQFCGRNEVHSAQNETRNCSYLLFRSTEIYQPWSWFCLVRKPHVRNALSDCLCWTANYFVFENSFANVLRKGVIKSCKSITEAIISARHRKSFEVIVSAWDNRQIKSIIVRDGFAFLWNKSTESRQLKSSTWKFMVKHTVVMISFRNMIESGVGAGSQLKRNTLNVRTFVKSII